MSEQNREVEKLLQDYGSLRFHSDGGTGDFASKVIQTARSRAKKRAERATAMTVLGSFVLVAFIMFFGNRLGSSWMETETTGLWLAESAPIEDVITYSELNLDSLLYDSMDELDAWLMQMIELRMDDTYGQLANLGEQDLEEFFEELQSVQVFQEI